ncbi:MAG: alpha-1,3/4-fucosidase, partial [Paramuribaculum sp.]|nr:alpha-1,3/4-fucosidase [Paramuribaculum sp.]
MKLLNTLLLAAATASVAAMPAGAQTGNANTIRIEPTDTREQVTEKAVHVVPTPNQLAALERGYIAFIHFGPNTFSRREWGTGFEDPADFKLENL